MNTSTSLASLSLKELRDLARREGLKGYSRLRKDELVELLQKQPRSEKAEKPANGIITSVGYLDITKDGKGFLRGNGKTSSPKDIYVSPSQIKRFALRPGDLIVGQVRKPKSGEKYRSLVRVSTVNGEHPDKLLERPRFEQLTPVFPQRQLILETRPYIIGPRLIDLISPIGRGQRGLIISPPGAGRSTLIKQIANSLADNYRDIHILVVLVGERPEDITDMSRSVKAEVLAAAYDEPPEQHIHVADLALKRAQRMVELGRDVVILMDSLTHLAHAHNKLIPIKRRAYADDVAPEAIHAVREWFGAARNLENSGSLTIIATCLVETENPLDDFIYNELEPGANMKLRLDKSLADRHIYPAIDILHSGTRHEELLLDRDSLQKVWKMRRVIEAIRLKDPNVEPLLAVRERLRRTKNNYEFLNSLARDN
ncbi:MAG: transcription termination factor Rho [Caldilineae bacterium]|nr:MAG: transcription termination factor Rho [Caldilineae bacterium]